ncbi:hypothetical protein IFM89_007358 [Coptis chinensis]|uniref:SET and MYND domain-containing protein 4 n=1 Tax=Coptis chinensis TaxID=261450 RepID=A0A835LDS6_9MAGN|nr:hypothetical protein IFM89_007358 [Coptis chinensis]
MEKLESSVPCTLKKMIAESTAEDLPSTCSSLLDFFLSLQLFHTVVGELTDTEKALCSKNNEIALEFKQKGNECFTSGDYDQALSFYTQALRFAPMDYANEAEKSLVSTLYINRASTLHKLGFLVECVRDCDRAVVLAPYYAKAWYRRGKANVSLESYKDAIKDFNVAISLELSTGGKRRIRDESVTSLKLPWFIVKNHMLCIMQILLKQYRNTHCHFCLNELPKDSVPCSSCSTPLYCSQNCQVQASGQNSWSNINNNLLDGNLSNNVDRHIQSIYFSNKCGVAVADSIEWFIPEHRHECGGIHWPAILPSEIILAGRVLVKLVEQRKQSKGTMKPIDALELTHNYGRMPSKIKLELHIYSVVLAYCLQRSCTVELPLDGNFASQLVILISQIRVNSMAVVHMKSQDSYRTLGQSGSSPSKDTLTTNIEQVRVGQAIYSTGSLFNHSCQPNIHAYFLSRTLFIRSTEFVTAGYPLELSYGPQVGQWNFTERQQLLGDQYAFKCQCSGCSELNFSDLVRDALSCLNPGCSGVVLDEHVAFYENQEGRCLEDVPSICSLEHRHPVDKMKREAIKKVGQLLFEQKDGTRCIDHGCCLNCGSYRSLEQSRIVSEKAKSNINRLQDTILTKHIPRNVLFDAVRALQLLRSTLHAYSKDIAQAEDNLAEAFSLVGDFQRAMHHCRSSIQILEKLYHPKHIVIGNELAKLASLELSLGECTKAMDSINRLEEIFSVYYGSHAGRIFPYLDSLQKDASKLYEDERLLHSSSSTKGDISWCVHLQFVSIS